MNILVLPKVRNKADLDGANEISVNIPGCNFVTGGTRISKRRKLPKVNRLVHWISLLTIVHIIIFFLCRDVCLKPEDSLFNWKQSKDPKGTVKKDLPRIVVTPPPTTTTRPVAHRKKSKRPSKTRRCVAAPPKLVLDLDPDFWSHQPEMQSPRARKQRIEFKCRTPQCNDQFSSIRDREMHERVCFSFDQVLLSTFATLI